MLIGDLDLKTPHIWFITNLSSELPISRKKPKQLKPIKIWKKKRRVSGEARKPEKNHFNAWEAPLPDDDMGLVSWMKFNDYPEMKPASDDDEDDVSRIRQNGFPLCPSIEDARVFERQSLHDRFKTSSCQYTGNDNNEKKAPSPPQPQITVPPKTTENVVPKQKINVESVKRACKSAIPTHQSPVLTSEEKEALIADDNMSLPARSCTSVDQSQTTSNAVDLAESKTKVRKLMGLAQKYMSKNDKACDEGEDFNDEGYDSKISNETEGVEELKNIEEVLLAREKYLAETFEEEEGPHQLNSFQWVRDPGGMSPGRIVKLSYAQRDKTFYSLNGDKFESLCRTLSKQNTGNNFRGIMAASLSNLSPSSLNMRHFRDSGNLQLLNCGVPATPRWGYENNSRGKFLPTQGDGDSKPMILRKVTIQDANGEGCGAGDSNSSPETQTAETPEFKRTETTLYRERSKVQVNHTSPQLTIDSTKINRNVSIPSPQQYRNISNKVAARRGDLRTPKYDPRDYILTDNASNSHIPLGDLLPAVERSIRKTQSQRGRRCPGYEASQPYPSLSEEERAILIKRDVDALAASYDTPHGPPAFHPFHTRSPLQRAQEISNKRLHGHVTQNPDGTETVRVASPRYQARMPHRRIGSSTGRGKEAVVTPRSPRQDRVPRLLLSKSKNVQGAF
ncbi:uncharacterized protein LOC124147974 isoform X3 [Haliotis rufescens]|uniref:uncharacterized protein LOC124147974 isoform X3 n=1 Tax=Haliotis rufescens TaxID=6454 RepID=UPI00201F61F8|nr:uncharacterized protein LOC124147974 isoform X3 [Haliotis rufescens]